MTLDRRDLNQFADDLEQAPDRILDEAMPVVKKAGQNIKTDAADRIRAATRGKYVRSYPASISFDVDRNGSRIELEVGPDKARPQGALGNVLEYGTANNAPRPHLNPAADAEWPKTETQLRKALVRGLLG